MAKGKASERVTRPENKTIGKAAKRPDKTTAEPLKATEKWTASAFEKQLKAFRPSTAKGYVKTEKDGYEEDDLFMGVTMGQVFKLAKQFMAMPTSEIKALLKSPVHEIRIGAVSIMDFKARDKKTPATIRKELFDLYLRSHNKINSWGMVDRAAPYVVGGFLFDKSREVLYKLARSRNIWERRTAIVSTYYFIRQGDVSDTFRIAELLVNDKEHFIHTAVGSWIREAGKKDPQRLLDFLNKHAPKMPRTALRYAVEHLDKRTRDGYMSR